MRRVTTTIPHDPPRSYGDCLRAALASLLGVDAVHVPHFADGGQEWWGPLLKWCFERGMYPEQRDPVISIPAGQSLALGLSALGVPHCVVMDADHQVHDPLPNGQGLVAIERYIVLGLVNPDLFFQWRGSCECSGSVMSVGQRGGITAGVVNL